MITPEQLAQREQAQNILIKKAVDFYGFDTLHLLRKEQRRERLLLTAIYFNLNTQEAQQLKDETEERNREEVNK